MGKEPKKVRPKQPPPDTFTSGQHGPKQETSPPPDSAPSGRLRFEEGDTPPQDGATSGQHGPKPSGKFRQDTERARPSDHMRREENADGDGGQEPHDKEAGPDRAGKKRTDGEKYADGEKRADGKERSDGRKPDKTEKAQEKADRPDGNWNRPGKSWPHRSRPNSRDWQRRLSGVCGRRYGFTPTTKYTRLSMRT